jgi:hypothetical protein
MPGPQKSKKPLEAKTKKQTSVSNSVKIDAVNPIPFEYNGQAFSYIQGQQYIPFLFPDDNFAKTLLEAKVLSATHTACIETKKTYCAGLGLYDLNGTEFDDDLRKWLKRINVKGESHIQLTKKAFGSLFTFGNIPIEVVRLTVAGKKKLFVYVHNMLEWRLQWPDQYGNVTHAIHSKLFLRSGIVSSDAIKNAKVLPLYDPDKSDKKNWLKDDKGVERTMIWIKNDMDGYLNYGMPSSVASLIYQVLEYKHARYNLDNLENNMVIGGMLIMKGNLGQEEANRIGKDIIKTHTGDGKRGRIVALASEEGIDGSDFHEFETTKEGSFETSDDKVMSKILLANEWSAMLAGLSHENTMGRGNAFLKKEYDIKKATVIDPAQKFLITNMWEPIFQLASNFFGNNWGEFELDIDDIDPVSSLADVDPALGVTLDELRYAMGLPEDETGKGKLYLSELKPAAKKPADQGGNNAQA